VELTVNAQEVINRLAERSVMASRQPVRYRLGSESLPRRSSSCSACTVRPEFELDQAVARLIKSGAFKGTGVCPYQAITSHLVVGLIFRPEIFRAKSAARDRVDPVVEIKGALKRIGTITRATGWSREDIEGLSNKVGCWEAVEAVFAAEHALEKALAIFRSQRGGLPRGPAGALHIQAVARAMATAWHVLTGRLPAKDNVKFHDLLLAGITTLFGYPAKEPNLESATRTAVERIKKDAASRPNSLQNDFH
jgi:hypothetical protein